MNKFLGVLASSNSEFNQRKSVEIVHERLFRYKVSANKSQAFGCLMGVSNFTNPFTE